MDRAFSQAEGTLPQRATEFAAAFRRHLPIHLVAVIAFAIALGAAYQCGVSIYYGYAFDLCSNLFKYAAIIGAVLFVKRFIELDFIHKRSSPAHAALASLSSDFVGENAWFSFSNLVNFTNFVAAFCLFAISFGALKTSIALLHPFSWDIVLRDLDKTLHFGRLPHEWLPMILAQPWAVFTFNVFYNLWFFVVLGALFFAGLRTDDPHSFRFITSFFVVWIIGGFLLATTFSSAGPCYFERIGLGQDYAPLMARLDEANKYWPIWALQTQNMLWDGYTGAIRVSPGISAFPSMHVGSATLIMLWAWKQGRGWGVLALGYLLSILLGSVVLGWHYAVDGYFSVALSWLVWVIASRIVPFDEAARLNGLEPSQRLPSSP